MSSNVDEVYTFSTIGNQPYPFINSYVTCHLFWVQTLDQQKQKANNKQY